MKSRLAVTVTLAVWVSAALAAPAFAHDNGEGLIGETDDAMITFFCLGVIAFLVVVVSLGSFLQGWLEKRKEERKQAELRQRTGW